MSATGTELIVPGTPSAGTVLELADTRAVDLVALLDELADLEGKLAACKRAIRDELAARADRRGGRTVTLDGVKLEVNAPTEELYDVGRLREELEPLIADRVIDRALLNDLIIRPPAPPAPPPRVDRRRVNALKRSDDKRLLSALAAARTVTTTTRTVKVIERPVDADAEELTA